MMCTNGLLRRIGLAFACISLGAFLLTGMSAPCRAVGTLDQEFVPPSLGGASLWAEMSLGQTFTVGLDGTLLGFDVYLINLGAITSGVDWEVQSTTAGLPDGTVLDSGTIAGTSISGSQWIPVDVSSAAISVASGEVYSILLTGQVPQYDSAIKWVAATSSDATYADGEKVYKTNPSGSWSFQPSAAVDYGFRTYVVPEPSQAALTLVALGTLLAGSWIRKSTDRS